jgi:hypothetical protein
MATTPRVQLLDGPQLEELALHNLRAQIIAQLECRAVRLTLDDPILQRYLTRKTTVTMPTRRRPGPPPEPDRDRTTAEKASAYDFFLRLLTEPTAKHIRLEQPVTGGEAVVVTFEQEHFPKGSFSPARCEQTVQLLQTILEAVAQHGDVRMGLTPEQIAELTALEEQLASGETTVAKGLKIRNRMLRAESEGIAITDVPAHDQLRPMVVDSWGKRSLRKDHLARLLTAWFEGMNTKETERVRSLTDQFRKQFKATQTRP